MPKKRRYTLEAQQERVRDLSHGRIELVHYEGAKKKCLFKDVVRDTSFKYNFCNLIDRLQRNPHHVFTGVPNLDSLDFRKKQTQDLSEGAIELLEYKGLTKACKFRYAESGTEFTVLYTHFLKFVGKPGHEFTGEWGAKDLKQQQRKVRDLSGGRVRLLSYAGADQVCLFADDNGEFEYGFSNLLRALRANPEHTFTGLPAKKSEEEHRKNVLERSGGRVELVEYNGYMGNSVFLDVERGVEFTYYLSTLLQNLKRDPEYTFTGRVDAWSLEDKKEKVHHLSDGNIQLLEQLNASEYTVLCVDSGEKTTVNYQRLILSLQKNGRYNPNDQHTAIEQIVMSMLKGERVVRNKKLPPSTYRPDFFLPEYGLVIECDGLYWHSEKVLANNGLDGVRYHQQKLQAYEALGYTALFFREDEILHKTAIVQSVLEHRLRKTPRKVFARKCTITSEVPSTFFEDNHLMGVGSGAKYGLQIDGELVAAIQVKWKNKKLHELEVSRFCTRLGVSVLGGYSKLLAHVDKELIPAKVINFIDRRYGKGAHMPSLGFFLESERPSFKWTYAGKTYHRMQFPGRNGVELGLLRVWDCGQAKWVKQ